jgi:hypothetical protein
MLRNFIRSFRRKSRYPFAEFLCIGISPASADGRTVPEQLRECRFLYHFHLFIESRQRPGHTASGCCLPSLL